MEDQDRDIRVEADAGLVIGCGRRGVGLPAGVALVVVGALEWWGGGTVVLGVWLAAGTSSI